MFFSASFVLLLMLSLMLSMVQDDMCGHTSTMTVSRVSAVVIEGDLTLPKEMQQGESIHKYFPNVTAVNGTVIVYQCNSLVNLNALKQLEHIGALGIHENGKLTSLEGLEKVESLDVLSLHSNNKLKTFKGLNNLESIKELYIYYNKALSIIGGFNKLKSVGHIDIDFREQHKVKKIVFGKKGNTLGYPSVSLYFVEQLEYMNYRDIKKSFSSICLEKMWNHGIYKGCNHAYG